jgi:hypothetical protein
MFSASTYSPCRRRLDWAAQEIGLARRDGAYELLLTTPLNPSDIVWGVLEALRWHFQALANVVLFLNALMMLGGLWVRPWNSTALVVYFLIWLVLLTWTWRLGRRWSRVLPVMWASLNCGRPARAVYALWRTSGFHGWSWIWILFNLSNLGRSFRGFPTGSLRELVFISVLGLIGLIWLASQSLKLSVHVRDFRWEPRTMVWIEGAAGICETRLTREFREIVREPLPDPNDRRFKKWDVRERFPWGWELVQQQLHERLTRQ